ncbi:MAG: DsbA family protein [Minisyncoccia bacterium]
MKKTSRTYILITLIIASFILSYAGGFKGAGLNTTKEAKVLKALDFINKNLLQNATATAGEITEESGVYKFELSIGTEKYISYLTKDGKILFPQGIALTTEENEKTAQKTTETTSKKTCEELKKSDKPLLEAFVVSKCPFGLQMQRILNEIIKNIPQLAQYIKVEYIGGIVEGKINSMHGEEEAQENLRQICIREEQKDKYWSYIDCHIKSGKVDECLASAKIDSQKLTSCINDAKRGIAYAQKDFERQDKFNVTGSPTLILNEESVSEMNFGGRTAEAVKTVICCSFKNQPAFCETKLTTDQAATSFSETYSQGSSNSGSCN